MALPVLILLDRALDGNGSGIYTRTGIDTASGTGSCTGSGSGSNACTGSGTGSGSCTKCKW